MASHLWTAALLVSARPEGGAGAVASWPQHALRRRGRLRVGCCQIVARREVSESLSGSENGARQELLPPTQASYGTAAAAVDALDRVAGMIKKAAYRSSPGPAGAAGRRHHAAMHTVVRNAARGSRHVTHVGY